ncbi:MAG: GAF domain-containing sensor histidine kinase [Anaerolineae bacterium]|nr:GAF domain-containing sensor histidine kinase [Anaerolineae bacterium]
MLLTKRPGHCRWAKPADSTLQRIADTARALAQTRYAALGVLGEEPAELRQFITSGITPQEARHIIHEPHGRGLLGAIFTEGKPIRINNIANDPRSIGFCQGHPSMHSFLGVPITNRGKRLGNLYLCDRLDGQPFSDQDEEVVALLAAHAAIAIENAYLHEQLQTVALRSERDRIGMELHDGVIQSIYAVGMKLEILRAKLNMNPEQHQQVDTILQDLNHIIEDIRSYIRNLISAHDEQATLQQKVETLVAHFRDFSGVNVSMDLIEGLPVLSDLQRHNLLQILRESLANIARHAQATQAHIRIAYQDKEVCMLVTDNGRGFTDENGPPASRQGHFGLRNIDRRAHRLGGNMHIESIPGQGTELMLRFPVLFDGNRPKS